jgi:hypothetical protein
MENRRQARWDKKAAKYGYVKNGGAMRGNGGSIDGLIPVKPKNGKIEVKNDK